MAGPIIEESIDAPPRQPQASPLSANRRPSFMTQAVFTRGSTMRHVLAMTMASATGLLAMFGVDLIDMYFLTLLGEQALVAAVGFAGTLVYFLVSVSIGLQIALGALVARSEGAHRRDLAGRYCSSALLFNGGTSLVISILGWLFLPQLLVLLGAKGVTLDYAIRYAAIMLPSIPILVVGMSAAAGVRAVGDPRRAMWATIVGSFVNAALDPLFIFTFDWGLEGAAWASVVSRFVVLVVAWRAVYSVHHLPRRVSYQEFRQDLGPIMAIAGPAVLTNLATPIGNGYVLRTMSEYGDSAVAGAAIMGRIAPVAFAAVFALSGAVGPIIGQNAGAGLYSRVRSTLRDALVFNAVYVCLVWLIMIQCADLIVRVFSASDTAAGLIYFYTYWLVGAIFFNGSLFVANACFNNLGHPRWATVFNFGKVMLGVIPAVYLGSQWYGAKGVFAGEAIGSIAFGVLAMIAAFMLAKHLEQNHRPAVPQDAPGA